MTDTLIWRLVSRLSNHPVKFNSTSIFPAIRYKLRKITVRMRQACKTSGKSSKMQFGGDHKRQQKYPLRVQLYEKPPEYDISLEEFYLLGKKRMEGKMCWTRQNGLKDKPVKELNENLPDWSPVSEQMCWTLHMTYWHLERWTSNTGWL